VWQSQLTCGLKECYLRSMPQFLVMKLSDHRHQHLPDFLSCAPHGAIVVITQQSATSIHVGPYMYWATVRFVWSPRLSPFVDIQTMMHDDRNYNLYFVYNMDKLCTLCSADVLAIFPASAPRSASSVPAAPAFIQASSRAHVVASYCA